ncbi:GNAT family N-acetyltransferase [Pseudoalteromonas tunicata]|uniref:N-acetyltransferase domain-containing protein n=1 Tax=Pseudoalteromonas tunicata D2 TaxID=87626 RepID=A4CAA6_9GAMM|nr:GNAT family N-acetyltransferase [Pseudoalteromonas tunicata]ATC94864.1 diamine N-acetyltransferase [Pseudoalteromonas tunicata]AXT30551.1 GNAT family N-acetyltransferase [Pseudoalteromonas tunicata]EAR28314.1 hypothetical protein PTD2_20902 [Pseudoalteromonas tunicata D2]MDP4983494.1 GNAT family N-acetyltransferase [Pseudoalteromonas tunicata]
MTLSLREIDSHNYEDVCDLELQPEQVGFLASNTWTLVEAAYNSGYHARAIYLSDQLVGLVMWVQETPERISIWRFMIDCNYQQQGLGRHALSMVIEEIKQVPDLNEIEICYSPKNSVAQRFFASLGFIETGMDVHDEDMLAVILL